MYAVFAADGDLVGRRIGADIQNVVRIHIEDSVFCFDSDRWTLMFSGGVFIGNSGTKTVSEPLLQKFGIVFCDKIQGLYMILEGQGHHFTVGCKKNNIARRIQEADLPGQFQSVDVGV